MSRHHLETHPWISFKLDLERQIDSRMWMLLGEVISKSEHIAGAPLKPGLAEHLNEIYLSKGAHATTWIEGNTLTEEEVLQRVQRKLDLPPSQEYLGQEIDNIVKAYNVIIDDIVHSRSLALTPERIALFNQYVLEGVPIDEGVEPGRIRTKGVGVGTDYRGAPAEDCEHLLDQLCIWFDEFPNQLGEEYRQALTVIAALLAHLYIAWIHPFGDGNGRTARLVEFQLLNHAGVPTLSAHLPSDYYMRTRTQYYRVLQQTSRPPYPVGKFLRYALEGFVDELRDQVKIIQAQQLDVSWVNFVHEMVSDGHTPASVRQRYLVLDLLPYQFTQISKIPELSPRLAAAYAGKTRRTVSRDINALDELGLIVRERGAVRPFIEQMQAFLPLRARTDEPDKE
ncbi:Fic family protein [Sphaerisporangium album]|uniref:Fic family protein n=1 Tax=Sphaerisporangium album TaxID=509200 RepID=UPI001C6927DF|nr:Fic family protein [Sphaerisporangium album]